jgi:hypothetical protein
MAPSSVLERLAGNACHHDGRGVGRAMKRLGYTERPAVDLPPPSRMVLSRRRGLEFVRTLRQKNRGRGLRSNSFTTTSSPSRRAREKLSLPAGAETRGDRTQSRPLVAGNASVRHGRAAVAVLTAAASCGARSAPNGPRIFAAPDDASIIVAVPFGVHSLEVMEQVRIHQPPHGGGSHTDRGETPRRSLTPPRRVCALHPGSSRPTASLWWISSIKGSPSRSRVLPVVRDQTYAVADHSQVPRRESRRAVFVANTTTDERVAPGRSAIGSAGRGGQRTGSALDRAGTRQKAVVPASFVWPDRKLARNRCCGPCRTVADRAALQRSSLRD